MVKSETMNLRKTLIRVFIFFLFSNLAFAATGDIKSALATLCKTVSGLIPIASFLMIVLAAVIYAAGQMMGAETRARANVWATACLTGAIIGLVIVTIAPSILNALYAISTSC